MPVRVVREMDDPWPTPLKLRHPAVPYATVAHNLTRILFLAPRFPFPPTRGDQVRTFHLARALARRPGVELTFLSFGEPGGAIDGVAKTRTVKASTAGRLAANVRRPDPRIPMQARLFCDRAMDRALNEELARGTDVVHVTLARMGPYMPRGRAAHVHIDLVDSLYLNMRTRAEASNAIARPAFALEAALLKSYEARLAREADSASLVSGADRKAPGLENVPVVPLGVDLEEATYSPPRPDAEPRLVFFGNLGYFHNVEPARFLAHEVLPRVRESVPGATLRLVGARPAKGVRQLATLPGVELRADVPDMRTELSAATVAMLPMFSGSGLKNKVLEAFASGLPVISNRLGMEGVAGAAAGTHFATAEDADALAAEAVALLSDPERRTRLAEAARDLIEREYSWDRQVDLLLALYGV